MCLDDLYEFRFQTGSIKRLPIHFRSRRCASFDSKLVRLKAALWVAD